MSLLGRGRAALSAGNADDVLFFVEEPMTGSRIESAVAEATEGAETSEGSGNGNGTATATQTTRLRGRHKVRVKIVGITPLLMHAMPADDVVDILIRKIQKKINTDASLEEMAAERLYKDPEGRIGIPSENLFATLRAAGRDVKLSGRKTVSTATSSTLGSFLQILDTFFPITPNAWKPDVRKGNMKNKGQSTAVGIVRPRFDKWGFDATLLVDFDKVNVDTLKDLFAKAGTLCGLCSFRPNHNGVFGQFELASLEVEA
ncbi:hypothetical protein HY629_02720 [Candidatus Uhrbacteria bacterium]|nr:hypothetical protein [Candidatus Uhrbacteria bacterium]